MGLGMGCVECTAKSMTQTMMQAGCTDTQCTACQKAPYMASVRASMLSGSETTIRQAV